MSKSYRFWKLENPSSNLLKLLSPCLCDFKEFLDSQGGSMRLARDWIDFELKSDGHSEAPYAKNLKINGCRHACMFEITRDLHGIQYCGNDFQISTTARRGIYAIGGLRMMPKNSINAPSVSSINMPSTRSLMILKSIAS